MARRKRGNFLSKQAPLSTKQRTRRFCIWLGIALGVVAMSCIAAYFALISWLQGEGFRQKLAQALQAVTQAQEVSIPENLTIDGSHVTLPQCSILRMKNVEELSVRKMHLEVDRPALLKRILRLQQFSTDEMQLTINLSKQADPAPQKAKKPTAKRTNASSGSSFFKDIQARSFESHYTDTNFIINDQKYTLSGYRLVALPRPATGKDCWAIAIENGRVSTPLSWLKESGVKNATLLYSSEEIQLNECKVMLTPGHLSAKGIYHRSSGLWKARLDIHQANVARLLNDDWRKRLTGSLNGRLDMSGETSSSWEAQGELRLEKGVLEGLPILSDIRLHGTTPYRTLELEKASCQISYPYTEPEHNIHDAWLWEHIDIRAKDGVLIVRGRVILGKDGSLSGTLKIGVPAKLVSEIGLEKSKLTSLLFNAPVEIPGYIWLHVNLSGTIDEPQEDISVRLATVLPQCLPEMADKAVQSLNSVLGSFLPSGMLPQPKAEEAATSQEKGKSASDDEEEEAAPPAPKPTQNKIKNIINTGLDMIF